MGYMPKGDEGEVRVAPDGAWSFSIGVVHKARRTRARLHYWPRVVISWTPGQPEPYTVSCAEGLPAPFPPMHSRMLRAVVKAATEHMDSW
jgi:hypothetical protein